MDKENEMDDSKELTKLLDSLEESLDKAAVTRTTVILQEISTYLNETIAFSPPELERYRSAIIRTEVFIFGGSALAATNSVIKVKKLARAFFNALDA